jgi:hypothetical protein
LGGAPVPGPAPVTTVPSLAVAPDGTLGVTFYDHRYDAGQTPSKFTDFWFRHSQDGGQTWQEEHLSGPFFSSYRGVSVSSYPRSIIPLLDGFATAFTLGLKVSPGSGQGLPHPPTGVFYSKLSLDMKLASEHGVVSRKVHGDAGTFDLDLPLSGTPGIECRSGGATNDYTLVFTFVNELASVGRASVTGRAAATVANSAIDNSHPHQYIVNFTGVSNAQYVTVTLTNVTDSAGNFSTAVSATMGVLIGDVNADGGASNLDVSLVKAKVAAGATVDSSNFRDDVNADGGFGNLDVSLTKAQVAAGAQLPTPP